MPFPIDWRDESENGARFVNSTPMFQLSGTYSLLGESDGTEWDVEFPGFRKSSSIYLHPMHNRGFSDGKIRTLIRRNTSFSPDSWGGIFFLSDRLGIGTRLDPGLNRYEVSDEDNGNIKIIKVTNAIKTTLLDTGIGFFPDTIYGFEVMWEYDITLLRTLIVVKLGLSLDFSDLTTIGTYSDTQDSFNTPHQFSDSEGFFFQAASSDDFISFNFDKTTISRFISI
jgi:hypothetical protein